MRVQHSVALRGLSLRILSFVVNPLLGGSHPSHRNYISSDRKKGWCQAWREGYQRENGCLRVTTKDKQQQLGVLSVSTGLQVGKVGFASRLY